MNPAFNVLLRLLSELWYVLSAGKNTFLIFKESTDLKFDQNYIKNTNNYNINKYKMIIYFQITLVGDININTRRCEITP